MGETKLSPDEAVELGTLLNKWKDEGGPSTLNNVLKRISNASFQKEDFNRFLPHYKAFVRSLNNEEALTQESVELIKTSRAHIKKLEDMFSKMKEKAPLAPLPLVKKSSESMATVEVPKTFGSALSISRRQVLHNLYKSFVHNMSEQHKRHPSLLDFIAKVQANLYDSSKGDGKIEIKLAGPVIEGLAAEKAITAKIRMLNGKTAPSDVAHDKTHAFMSDQEIKKYEEASKKEMEYMDVDFYTVNLKKMTGSEPCRFCKKDNTAFCEYQKQTRRSDEPMTRFMRCNSCSRTWRD